MINCRADRPIRRIVLATVSLLVFVLAVPDAAADVANRLKVSGQFRDGVLHAQRVVRRDPSKRADAVRLQGVLERTAAPPPNVRIGGVDARLDDALSNLGADIPFGQVVEAAATRAEGTLVIESLEPVADAERDIVELIGAVEHEERLATGDHTLTIAGVTVLVPRTLYAQGQPRTQRLDDRRPDQQLTTTLLGRRLVIGGEVGVDSGWERDRRLGREDDDTLFSTQQEVQIEGFVSLTQDISGFLELKAQRETEYHRGRDVTDHESRLERGEAWLLWEQVAGTSISVQIGRQNFADDREWWWDQDLDALRVTYDRFPVHLELAFAAELAAVDLRENHIDPEQKDLRRWLGSARWQIDNGLQLAAFLLRQRDGSSRSSVGDRVRDDRQDELDANLDWFGLRALGKHELGESELKWWADLAWLRGTEYRIDYDERAAGGKLVDDIERARVCGFGLDVGASLVLPWQGEPTLTLTWARGSGDAEDGAFRQSGLHDNNWKFNGVDRFRYYGEIARPELANLAIATIAFGLTLDRSSSLEVLLHDYRRVARRGPEPELRLRGDFAGDSNHVGNEIDVVLGVELGAHWEIELTAGWFLPGRGWASDSRDAATGAVVKVNYNF